MLAPVVWDGTLHKIWEKHHGVNWACGRGHHGPQGRGVVRRPPVVVLRRDRLRRSALRFRLAGSVLRFALAAALGKVADLADDIGHLVDQDIREAGLFA